jgi:hypothetical protein
MNKHRNFHNITTWDIVWITIIVLILSVLAALLVSSAVSAATDCKAHYVVKPYDTLRTVATRYKLDPWQVIKANRNQTEKPNYPIYLWSSLCIPYPTYETKKIADTILDQPPAQMLITQKGKELTIRAYGFANGSNWFIREGGDKLGKMKIIKKVLTTRTLKTDAGLLTVCLKNQMTDFLYCGKVKQVK